MDKVIYFNNENQKEDLCKGQVYFDFLEYAFREATYFMLVYVNYYGKGFSKQMKCFKDALKAYKIKSRSNPSWPGVPSTSCPNTTYKVEFYKTDPRAKEVLKRVNKLSDWSAPSYPQDLAFFKGNKCWFYSVGHEKIGAIIGATKNDLDFLSMKNLANPSNAVILQSNYYNAYDEVLESDKGTVLLSPDNSNN